METDCRITYSIKNASLKLREFNVVHSIHVFHLSHFHLLITLIEEAVSLQFYFTCSGIRVGFFAFIHIGPMATTR